MFKFAKYILVYPLDYKLPAADNPLVILSIDLTTFWVISSTFGHIMEA